MRAPAAIVGLVVAAALPTTAIAPSASAEGQCRAGYTLYDTGSPGAFKEDRNLNGLVCDKTVQVSGGFRHRYTDDR